MAVHKLLKTMTVGYRPVTTGTPASLWSLSSTRGFSLAQVESMREDSQVSLCLGYRGTPLTVAQIQVQAKNPQVKAFVERQFKRFWAKSLAVALEAHAYGYSAAEVLYRRKRGWLHFDELKYIAPRDAEIWTRRGRRYAVKIVSGGQGSITRAENANGIDLPCARQGVPAKGWWWVHDPLHDPWYGRSVLTGAWLPWRLKTLPGGGGMDAIAKWFYRHGYRGYKVRHPDTVYQDDPSQPPVDAQALARQMMESMKAGADIALSSARDESGQYLWDVESYGEINGSAGDMIAYVKDFLDVQIQRGIGIPDGILTDGGGQGYAGRKIPEDAYYAGCEFDLNSLVETFDEQVVRGLVALNFGANENYSVEPGPLVPSRQQAAQEGQQKEGNEPKEEENPLAALAAGDVGDDGQQDSGAGGTFPLSLGYRLGGEWSRYRGKRSGKTGWRNATTGEIRYQTSKPKDRGTAEPEPATVSQRRTVTQAIVAAARKSWGVFKAAGRKAREIEHVAQEFVTQGIDDRIERLKPRTRMLARAVWKLTKLGTKAAFATYIAGQGAAESVARQIGASDEQALKIKGFCTALDLAGAKATPLALGAIGLGGIGLAASMLPVGSMAYLCYASSRHPVKTARAAIEAVAAVVRRRKQSSEGFGALSLPAGSKPLLAHFAAQVKEYGDWYEAVAYAALGQSRSLEEALRLADEVLDVYPETPPQASGNRSLRLATKSPWQPYVGVRGARKGQKGWKHAQTGRVSWTTQPPDAKPGKEPARKGKKVASKEPTGKGKKVTSKEPTGKGKKVASKGEEDTRKPVGDWEPYLGKAGSRKGESGWKHRHTGKVVWGKSAPMNAPVPARTRTPRRGKSATPPPAKAQAEAPRTPQRDDGPWQPGNPASSGFTGHDTLGRIWRDGKPTGELRSPRSLIRAARLDAHLDLAAIVPSPAYRQARTKYQLADTLEGITTASDLRSLTVALYYADQGGRDKVAEQLGLGRGLSARDIASAARLSLQAEHNGGTSIQQRIREHREIHQTIDRLASLDSGKDYIQIRQMLARRIDPKQAVQVKTQAPAGMDWLESFEASEGVKWLSGLVRKPSHGKALKPIRLTQSGEKRPFYDMQTHSIAWEGEATTRSTMIHELGHALEVADPEIHAAVDEFWHSRTQGDSAVSMKARFPGQGYADNEWVYPDRFALAFNNERYGHYAGKEYGWGSGASEILSMGVQALYDDPAGFARRDPEYCAFVLGLLDGSLRRKPLPPGE